MKKKLGNPAVATALSSEQGQKAIQTMSENQRAIVQQTASTIPFLIKTFVFVGLGVFVWYKFNNRFRSFSENSSYPASNVTDSQAKAKAEAIFASMYGLGANVNIVAQNLAGLNYNGFVKVYNAFGARKSAIPFSDKKNMIQWFTDEFSESELEQLRFLVGRNFF